MPRYTLLAIVNAVILQSEVSAVIAHVFITTK